MVTAGVTFGLPSRSPPVQVPNRNGAAVTGSSTPKPSEHGRDVGQHLRDGQPLGLDQVEDGVAGLVDGLGSLAPELVGEPEQVDDLRQPSVRPFAQVGARGQRGVGRLRVEQIGDGPELGERRSARRLGRDGR